MDFKIIVVVVGIPRVDNSYTPVRYVANRLHHASRGQNIFYRYTDSVFAVITNAE